MATFQLGPEKPRPFSVLSEGHVFAGPLVIDVPSEAGALVPINDADNFTFGRAYESGMCEFIHKYLELGTDDKLCYVGEAKGSLCEMLKQRFCLLEPVTEVLSGHIHFQETESHKMLPMKLSNVGAEDYFKTEVAKGNSNLFDKILLKDTVNYLENPKELYNNALKLLREDGRLLIIQRPGTMMTLPVFQEAKDRLLQNDSDPAVYLKIIHDLQGLGLDVEWDIECLPIVMPKMRWLRMVKQKFPPIMEVMSSFEIKAGLRELSEGILKYEGDMVEFQDRLIFISASRPIFSKYPTIQRYGSKSSFPAVKTPKALIGRDLSYKMEVTSDIRDFVREKERKEARRVSFSKAGKK